ncbi:MAG: high-potential iron-sulfur protein [Planctomycetes bacterium]|nr:high-potential iron-sulfur protein [Planctomycetota bacterium]
MSSTNRRRFLFQVAAGTSALALSRFAVAEEAKPALTEDDAYAKSMGFRLNTEDVDQAKYPKHTTDQSCSKCQLYSGAEGDELGPCSFFGKRLVPPTGWCRNFKPKGAA